MRLMFKSSKRGSGPGALCTLGIAPLCTLILCGYALGQAQPPAESKGDSKPAVRKTTKVEPRTKAGTPTSVDIPARPRPVTSDFEMDANAKLVCENRLVKLDPVWRDGKNLTFPFKIRNDGTADLKIKAKGG